MSNIKLRVYNSKNEDDFMEFELNENVTLKCLREKIAEEEEINIENEDILRRSMRLSHRDCDDEDGIIEDEDDTKVSDILEIESEEDFDEIYEIDVEYLTAASAKRKLVFLKSKADRKIIVGGKQKFEVLIVNNRGAKYELKTPKFKSYPKTLVLVDDVSEIVDFKNSALQQEQYDTMQYEIHEEGDVEIDEEGNISVVHETNIIEKLRFCDGVRGSYRESENKSGSAKIGKKVKKAAKVTAKVSAKLAIGSLIL